MATELKTPCVGEKKEEKKEEKKQNRKRRPHLANQLATQPPSALQAHFTLKGTQLFGFTYTTPDFAPPGGHSS